MGELHGYGYDMTAFDPQNLDSQLKNILKLKPLNLKKNLLLIIK